MVTCGDHMDLLWRSVLSFHKVQPLFNVCAERKSLLLLFSFFLYVKVKKDVQLWSLRAIYSCLQKCSHLKHVLDFLLG